MYFHFQIMLYYYIIKCIPLENCFCLFFSE